MTVKFLPKFNKQFQILPTKIRGKFRDRLALFLADPTDARLRVHPLTGKYIGYWSMNISGDFRALFYYEDDVVVVFALIGTHSQLYG